MADFGLTPEGFNPKRLRDVLDDFQAELEQITDPDTGETLQIDWDSDDPFIQAFNTFAEGHAEIWQIMQLVYRSFDPNSATGAALAANAQLNGVLKRGGLPSTIPVSLAGTPGTLIEAGQRISDAQQTVVFTTDEDYTLDGGGSATGTATATVNGPNVALSSTITTILTPVAGWDSVTNTADATIGRDEETDASLRARRNKSTETPSVAPVEATYGNLSQLDGVIFARAYVNNTLATDSRGIPAKSLAAVVVGGDDDEIARTLFLRNAADTGYFGDTTVTLIDLQGESYAVSFIRPDAIDIDVQVDVTVIDAGVWPSDGDTKIKEAIVAYAQGGRTALGITEGFEDVGFVPGVDVTLSRLYTPINSVPGHKVTLLEIAISGNPLGTADIPIAYDAFAQFQSVNITVNVTVP